ncbi:MAG: cytochrome C [Rhodocyclaceae bacterium]|nr:cytochrome C [Rhodocyclaceae bacterium]
MNKKISSFIGYLVASAAFIFCASTLPAAAKDVASPKLDNATCLTCHDAKKLVVPGAGGKPRKLLAVKTDKYGQSVHGKMECIGCHQEIKDAVAGHKLAAGVAKPDCASCHEGLWKDAKAVGKDKTSPRLGVVNENIEAYRRSFHARKNADHPDRVNAECTECHDTHFFNVPTDRKSAEYTAWRRGVPALCGECHDEQLEAYSSSVHGKQIDKESDGKGAVCIDCHTTHEITNTSLAAFKLLNPEECGSCHQQNLKTYRDTYHGQVTQLGDARTAKCFNCHGSHEIYPPSDEASSVHPENRLKTCKQCHDGKKLPMATAGFVSFSPHAHGGDFEKYPEMFIASKFMVGLLIFVFAFFWAHSGLWYYREWMDRKQGKRVQHVKLEGLKLDTTKHFRRFAWGWRVAHLAFALVTMTLVLTGTTAMFAKSFWAPFVAQLLGGAQMLGLIHRVAAAMFVGIFLIHFIYVMQKLLRDRTFRWFGPDSLIPNWKDFADCWGMFKWFFGKGRRPQFERWAYYEKFDYWAVFWGVNIIGWSGLMLAFPHVTAQYLPGWVFNVGTLVHGEEAFLAAVFLFTVHFFNNHFRPDKLPPPDVVMFTGTQSLEEFRHDHPAHYQRMVESGEIAKYLVEAPSRKMHLGSVVLGIALLGIGFVLLFLVAIGFFTGVAG